MADDKVDSAANPSLLDPEKPNTLTDHTKRRTKRLAKQLVFFGVLWYIFHRWLFRLAHNYGFLGGHTYPCAHDQYTWVIDGFATPEHPEVPQSRLAENFFL